MNYAVNPYEDDRNATGNAVMDRAHNDGAYPEGMESLIDFMRIRNAIVRNRIFIAGIVAIALIAGALVTLLTTPLYTATASMIVNQDVDRVLDSEDVTPTVGYQEAERFLQTQVDILESRRLALRVIEAEGLAEDQEFLDRAGIDPDEALSETARANRVREAVLSHVSENLDVVLPIETRVVDIFYTDPNAAFSARIANSFVDTFIRDNLDRRAESSRYARQYLSTQLAEAKIRLEESERELNAFAQGAGIVQVGGSNNGTSSSDGETVTGRSLLRMNDAASDAEAARTAAEARWKAAANAPPSQLPEVVTNGAYQQLQTERARVQGALNQELAVHQEAHPTVQALRSQLESIEQQIATTGNNIKQSIRANYTAAIAQEQDLKRRVNSLQGEFLAEDSRGVQYGILAREVDTNRALYDGLLQRYKEVGAEEGLTSNNISKVDEAVAPFYPSAPRPLLNMALALVAGLILAAIFVFLREIIDDIIRTSTDVEEHLGIGTLGIIPEPDDDRESIDVAILDPKSSVSEAIHSLRTSVVLALQNSGSNVVLASSTQASEGKSTTLLALARDLTALGHSTVIIDADLRRAVLHKMAGTDNQVGLADVVAGSATIGQVIRNLPAPRGHDFIPSGTDVADPATVLNSQRLSDVVEELSVMYDYVLIDGPPVLGLADAPGLAAKFGNVLYMVQAGAIHARNARAAIRRLRQAGAKILGITLTKVDLEAAGYGYGYEYTQSYYRYDKQG